MKERVQVHFIGETVRADKESIQNLDLGTFVRTVGYLSHSESVGYLLEADALLMLVHTFPSIVPGKTYEYMRAHKPVLVLSTANGETRKLLEQAGVGIWADPENVSDIAGKLIHLLERWENERLGIRPDDVFIKSFSRRKQAGQLARVFDAIAS
jgi:glycosyltransferase involved in cell wall biosynthesis